MFYVRRVDGNSMSPALKHGQLVLFARNKKFKNGTVVLAHMLGKDVVKRIKIIDCGKVWLEGDNSLESTDSREYGPVKLCDIKGCMLYPRV